MNKGVRWWWYAAVTAAVVAVGGLLWWWRRVGDDDDGRRLAAMVVAVVLAAAGVAVKGMTMMPGGRVWGRWGDEAAEEPQMAGVWVAGGWPERVAAPDSGGGRRNPNGRRGREKFIDFDERGVLSKQLRTQKLEIECVVVPPWFGAGHATYTDQFHKLSRLVPHLVTPENKRIERNGPLKKNTKKRGYGGEPSMDGNVRDDTRDLGLGGVLPQPLTLFGRSTPDCKVGPRMVDPLNARNLIAARGACFECGGTGPYKAACPMLNRAPGQRGNRPNQVLVSMGVKVVVQGTRARGRAFMMGAEDARQDPNIVTGMFTLNNHYATTLLDSSADCIFVSTTFIPLLDIEPSSLGFTYEIEIASGQLIEINKVIHGCKPEIGGYTFDIGLIPFGHESFDVIVGMDWLSRHKAKIVCHKKVVRIPLPHGEMLKVLGERPKEKVRHLMSAKAEEQKLKDIFVVRNFSKVFPNDLLGLPPSREIEFRIDLFPGAMPGRFKSSLCLAPSEMEELSSQI
ncbi:putative reverse transcriptase domain-containing protein [Tanacetum coccineum]